MRTYIFTATERKAIQGLLDGRAKPSDPSVAYIRSRVKSFRNLAADVELYLQLRETVAATST